MKKILIIHSNMELGGAETSLLGLLQSIDYKNYSVDLFLFERKGELLSLIPNEVNILHGGKKYQSLMIPIKDILLKKMLLGIAIARVYGKIRGKRQKDRTYSTKQFAQYYALPFLPNIDGHYDMVISFIDPHYVAIKKVKAEICLGWLHTDFSRIQPNEKLDRKMWESLDYVVNISEACADKFLEQYPELASKSIIIENILSKTFIMNQALKQEVAMEIDKDVVSILSIGRFSEPKNFDNVPDICRRIRTRGINIKWYLIGYGGDEDFIHQKIAEFEMEDYVIILGKKTNPYPYIRACDLYVQPSRYEGKCVAIREAQILEKPVVITKYATSASQLEDGVDGIVVPMDNEGCAKGIADVLNSPELMRKLSESCAKRDYTNAGEVEKLYRMMDDGEDKDDNLS